MPNIRNDIKTNLLRLLNLRGVENFSLPINFSYAALSTEDLLLMRHDLMHAVNYVELRSSIGYLDENSKNYMIFVYRLYCQYLACRGELQHLEKYLAKLNKLLPESEGELDLSLELSVDLTNAYSNFVLDEICNINRFRPYLAYVAVCTQSLIMLIDQNRTGQQENLFRSFNMIFCWFLYLLHSTQIVSKFLTTVTGIGMNAKYQEVSLLTRINIAIEDYGDQLLNDLAWGPINLLTGLESFNIVHFADLDKIGGMSTIGIVMCFLDIYVSIKNMVKIAEERKLVLRKYDECMIKLKDLQSKSSFIKERRDLEFQLYCLMYARRFVVVNYNISYKKNKQVFACAAMLLLASLILSASLVTPLGLGVNVVFILHLTGVMLSTFTTTFYCICRENLIFNKHRQHLEVVDELLRYLGNHQYDGIEFEDEYRRLKLIKKDLEQHSFKKNYAVLAFFILMPAVVFCVLWFTNIPYTAIMPIFFALYTIAWLTHRYLLSKEDTKDPILSIKCSESNLFSQSSNAYPRDYDPSRDNRSSRATGGMDSYN